MTEQATRPETGLYAYAITRTADLGLAGITGLDDAVPRVVAHEGLGLVVSDIRLSELDEVMAEEQPTEQGRLAALARAHDAVVRVAFDQDAVLPLRFGTVLADQAAARRLLAERHDEALALLNHVAGSQEWGAKVRSAPLPRERATVPAAASSNGARPSGTEYLARRRSALTEAEQRESRRRQALDEVEAELAAHATDRVSRRQPAGEVVLDVAYLVPEQSTVEFLATAETSAAKLGEHAMELEITGPWPPYSFARADLTEVGDV